jgi:uncharacterized protein (TIGR00255 family)
MIHSMTGYATASREMPWGALSVELRSVNHRYLDVSFRMPDDLRAGESAMREAITAVTHRGKIECRVAMAVRQDAQQLSTLDRDLLARLLSLSTDVQAAAPSARPLSVADILRWPGLLATESVPAETLTALATDLLAVALKDFIAARRREGEKLAAVIEARIADMRARIATVAPRLPAVISAFETRLNTRLREALASLDEERVRQEVALFINKIDVDEELSRLNTHLDEVQRVIRGERLAGKRLDFLMQELNREANTLGSKSADVDITRVSMDLKLLIEQMREQIQNIE